MGNRIDIPRVENSLNLISLRDDLSEICLNREFKTFFELIGTDLRKNIELISTMNNTVKAMKSEHVLNLIANIVKYLHIQINEEINMIKQSLELLSIIVESLFTKFHNLRELIDLSFEIKLNDNVQKIEIEKKVKEIFPMNILFCCISIYSNEQFFSNQVFFKNQFEKFDIAYLLSKILYDVIYYQRKYQSSAIHYVKYLDLFKIFLFSDICFNKDLIYKFLLSTFLNSFINYKNLCDETLDPYIAKVNYETYIMNNFYLYIWLITDNNKIFLSSTEQTFENDFNKKIYKFSQVYMYESNLNEKYILMNKYISDTNRYFILFHAHVLQNVIQLFFSNDDRLTYDFKLLFKVIYICLFETNFDFCESICLKPDIIKLILDKIKCNDIFDLFLLKQITLTKNFYIILKTVIDTNKYINTDAKLMEIFGSCLHGVMISRRENLKLDYVSYYLLLIIFNISENIREVNETILELLSEHIYYFTRLEIRKDNISENLLYTKIFYEIILSLLIHIEYPSKLILVLLKEDSNGYFETTHKKLLNFYDTYNNQGEISLSWRNYFTLYENLTNILKKFKTVINTEGSSVKYTLEEELIKIINRVSIDKNIEIDICKFKENKIFNTETEKFILQNINSYEKGNMRIFLN